MTAAFDLGNARERAAFPVQVPDIVKQLKLTRTMDLTGPKPGSAHVDRTNHR
ncbi:MAG TPA: hypothetical protein VFW60_06020 [Rhodanobacteraceae bacterium]|nr:hypothetical protein [Rhodanobacteraceae bacterium]